MTSSSALPKLKSVFISSIILFLTFVQINAQVIDEYALLNSDFPVLSKKYIQKIKNQTASYVFVVDNSNSITKYGFDGPIHNSIQEFLRAVPNGDRVSLIKFADKAEDIGIPATVIADDEIRKSLISDLSGNLNFTGNASDGFAAASKVMDAINKVGTSDLRYVFFLTDFEFYSSANGFNASKCEWNLLAERFANEQKGKKVVVIALKLQMGAINQQANYLAFLENIFPGMKTISVSPLTLKQWFADTKAEILRDRLKFLVEKEMQNKIVAKVKGKLSGNVIAEITMPEGTLEESISIEGAVPENKALSMPSLPVSLDYESGQTVKVSLGKLKHTGSIYIPRFENINGTTTLNCRFISSADNEMQKLGLPNKTFPITATYEGKSFIHFLPLFIDLVLAIFLITIIYQIAMVLKPYKFINDPDFSPQKGSGLTAANFRNVSSVMRNSIAIIGNSDTSEGKAIVLNVQGNLGSGTKFSIKGTKRFFRDKELLIKSFDGYEINDINEKWIITPGHQRYVRPGSIVVINKVEVTLPRIR